jgi:hypothetical protein
MRNLLKALLIFVFSLPIGASWAWKIEPVTTPIDAKLIRRIGPIDWEFWTFKLGDVAGRIVGDPLHEGFILRSKGCQLDSPGSCYESRSQFAPNREALFAGVQWNDNPPFILDKGGFLYTDGTSARRECLNNTIRLPRLSHCWKRAIDDAEQVADKLEKKGEVVSSPYPILYRSHYGDLQAIHAMASGKNEVVRETVAKMLVWAEFSYKVATGEIAPSTPLQNVQVPDLASLIKIRDRSVDLLFTLGDDTYRFTPNINWFALGSLLHMLQDSFSDAHVERGLEAGVCENGAPFRQPGKIQSFRSYSLQRSSDHAKADSLKAFHKHDSIGGANATDVTRNILDLFERTPEPARWPEVKLYVECVLSYEQDAAQNNPTAGEDYKK